MDNKVLSISIAAYNVEKYLSDTLDSICSLDYETLNKIEIIIVNDGSKDKTLAIARDYALRYPNIVFYVDKSNGGYGSTINSSLKISKGKYYKLLDGDDWYLTDNLKEFVEYLEKCEIDIVLTQYIERYENRIADKLKEQPYSYNVELPISDLSKYSMHALTVKTENIKNNVKITENCFYTDSEFFVKCAINSDSFISLPFPVYIYRLGREGQSVDVKSLVKHYDDWFYIANKLIGIYGENVKIKNMKNSIYSLLSSSLHICINMPLNKETINNYKSCISCLRSNYEDAKTSLTWKQKILVSCPSFFYFYKLFRWL